MHQPNKAEPELADTMAFATAGDPRDVSKADVSGGSSELQTADTASSSAGDSGVALQGMRKEGDTKLHHVVSSPEGALEQPPRSKLHHVVSSLDGARPGLREKGEVETSDSSAPVFSTCLRSSGDTFASAPPPGWAMVMDM